MLVKLTKVELFQNEAMERKQFESKGRLTKPSRKSFLPLAFLVEKSMEATKNLKLCLKFMSLSYS